MGADAQKMSVTKEDERTKMRTSGTYTDKQNVEEE